MIHKKWDWYLLLKRKNIRKGLITLPNLFFKQLSNECGFPTFPHLLRHTMTTYAFELRVLLDEVSLLLGHAELKTTRIYAKHAITEIKSTFKKISCKWYIIII